MTTITREQAQEIIDAADEVITALAGTNEDVHPDNSQEMIRLYDDLNDHYAPPEVVRELARIALASLNATPIYQVQYGQQWRDVSKEVYGDHRDHGSSTRIVYAEPPAPVTGIYDDVLNIIGLLENNEWAEHCTSTVLGSLLESEITRLVSKEQSAPVVPEEITDESTEQRLMGRRWAHSFCAGWNACRSAMLNGGKS
ncbi:hypothetical protein Sent08_00023 [Salmonella enterica]